MPKLPTSSAAQGQRVVFEAAMSGNSEESERHLAIVGDFLIRHDAQDCKQPGNPLIDHILSISFRGGDPPEPYSGERTPRYAAA